MADPQVAERTTGYVVGGISPLGQKALPTVIDASAQALPASTSVRVSAGFEIELSPTDLAT